MANMKLHPSRPDKYRFQLPYRGRSYLRTLWLAYVPLWVDTVLRCLFWFAVSFGIVHTVMKAYFWK